MRSVSLFIAFLVVAAGLVSAAVAQVHFIDVQHGDAVYIGLPGDIDIVIDGGWKWAGGCVVSYLRSNGLVSDGRIELVVATHYDGDHYNGLGVIVSSFQVGALLSPGPYEAVPAEFLASVVGPAKDKGAEVMWVLGGPGRTVSVGHTDWGFPDSAYKLTLLGPHRDWTKERKSEVEQENNNSIVLRLEGPALRVVFLGDAYDAAERDLLSYYVKRPEVDLSADVLKVGHHGSETSTTREILRAVKPTVAVISDDGRHVRPSVTNMLTEAGALVYQTDVHGTVVVRSDGERWWVQAAPCGGQALSQCRKVECKSWTEAALNIGRSIWVHGEVAGASRTTTGRIYLNMGADYPNQGFVIMIHEDHTPRFDRVLGYGFEKRLIGQVVFVYGKISLYENRTLRRSYPEILPTTPSQLVVEVPLTR